MSLDNETDILDKINNEYEKYIFKILKLYNDNLLNCNVFLKYEYKIRINILLNIIKYIDFDNNNLKIHKNYKSEYYINLYNLIINNINIIYDDINISDQIKSNLDNLIITEKTQYNLLYKITMTFKGHKLLNTLNTRVYKLCDNKIIDDILCYSASFGTILTFMFWLKLSSYNSLQEINNDLYEIIIINSSKNNDDRLYKYILNTHFINTPPIFIKLLINSILSLKIANKYILKKIKLLSNNINISDYLDYILSQSYILEYQIIIELYKNYNKNGYTFEKLHKLIIYILNLYPSIITIVHSDLYNLLNTFSEKIYFLIILNIKFNINIEPFVYNQKLLESIILDNINIIFNIINIEYLINVNNIFKQKFLNILCNYNLINVYCNTTNIYCPKILYYTRFFVLQNQNNLVNNNIKINKCLHYLRLYVKLKIKIKMNNYKIRMNDVFNEIIMNKKLSYNVFNNKEPIQLLSLNNIKDLYDNNSKQINYYINNKIFIKHKITDYTYNIPKNIYPCTDIFYNCKIVAEYIEDLNLYLISDIDIPDTNLLDRYNLLLKNHNYIDIKYINETYTINELISCLNNNVNNLKQFIETNKFKNDTYIPKWYPSILCYVNNNNIISEIINNIINNNLINEIYINKKIQNTNYECNSLVIVHNVIKYKDKLEISKLNKIFIDLKYFNNNWIDYDNNIWNIYINLDNEFTHYNNKIYRFYLENNKFILYEFKYNKFIADSYLYIKTTLDNFNYINEKSDPS
jgi:hypothetical protein